MKVAEQFRDAEALAEFANLDRENPAAVDSFRHNYPDFAPDEWWDYRFEAEEIIPRVMGVGRNPVNPLEYGAVVEKGLAPNWHEAQSQVWGAWENEFKFPNVFGLTALLRSVFVAPTEVVRTSSNLYLPDGDLCELASSKLYTYHKAVLYLYQNPWRAKMCHGCGKYFVANHPKRDFCEYPDGRGETCRQKNDNARHLAYYHKRGKKTRQRRTRAAKR